MALPAAAAAEADHRPLQEPADQATAPTLYCLQLYFNWAKPPLDNVKVRQAINFALDRDGFVKASLAGLGEPAYMNLPKAHWAYDETLVSRCIRTIPTRPGSCWPRPASRTASNSTWAATPTRIRCSRSEIAAGTARARPASG